MVARDWIAELRERPHFSRYQLTVRAIISFIRAQKQKFFKALEVAQRTGLPVQSQPPSTADLDSEFEIIQEQPDIQPSPRSDIHRICHYYDRLYDILASSTPKCSELRTPFPVLSMHQIFASMELLDSCDSRNLSASSHLSSTNGFQSGSSSFSMSSPERSSQHAFALQFPQKDAVPIPITKPSSIPNRPRPIVNAYLNPNRRICSSPRFTFHIPQIGGAPIPIPVPVSDGMTNDCAKGDDLAYSIRSFRVLNLSAMDEPAQPSSALNISSQPLVPDMPLQASTMIVSKKRKQDPKYPSHEPHDPESVRRETNLVSKGQDGIRTRPFEGTVTSGLQQHRIIRKRLSTKNRSNALETPINRRATQNASTQICNLTISASLQKLSDIRDSVIYDFSSGSWLQNSIQEIRRLEFMLVQLSSDANHLDNALMVRLHYAAVQLVHLCRHRLSLGRFSHCLESKSYPLMQKRYCTGPKEATDVLKQWIIDHSSNPYPNRKETQELSRVTGMTPRAISHWFANVRSRGGN